jgi:hypothetical protein
VVVEELRAATPLTFAVEFAMWRNPPQTFFHNDKVQLGRVIPDGQRPEILAEIQARPGWKSTLDAVLGTFACRAERRIG